VLFYVQYNSDVIIDVKTFWRPFLVQWYNTITNMAKRGTVHKTCSYFK